MQTQPEQIAIDGPAASGKSTVARRLAAALGALYVNTGLMYRLLTWYALSEKLLPTDTQAIAARLPDLQFSCQPGADGQLALVLNGQRVPDAELRAPAVTAAVSQIARQAAVRQWLVSRQRQLAELGLIVMEGRDIGTVVFPGARHKFYITASAEERARRRLQQDGETVDGATLASVAAAIAERDRIDSTRDVSPLRPAADAVVIDTTACTIDEVVAELERRVRAAWVQA